MMQMQKLRCQSMPCRLFSRDPEQLATLDLYTYDLVVAMDHDAHAECSRIFDEHFQSDWDSASDRHVPGA